jgi:dipeptidyl aminopeptidase/acylaminoacyl peptidase
MMLRMPGFVAIPVAKTVVTSALLYARWVDGLDVCQVSPVRDVANTPTPILLIHGQKDSRTPAWNSQKLVSANPRNSLWLVPNAEHTGAASADPVEFHRHVLNWFQQHL